MTDTDLDAFRTRCRDFLSEHASPLVLNGPDPRDDQTVAHSQEFLAKLAEAGLGGLTYATEYGGAGLTKVEERAWREEYAHFPDCSGAYTISHGMCLPMVNEFGTEEQKREFMPRMISGEDMWCQMFSEPGAGSDVASLQTRAVKDGDQWIINGQKVWTTLAHHSNYGVLIARTDPEVVKHAGISMFIVDMRDPAIEIRAIHQIDGGMHFNEIFFTDLAIPADWILGEYNAGWKQATAMLMYERVAIGTGTKSGITTPLFNRLKREATKLGTVQDPIARQKLMKIYSEEVAKSLVAMRTRAEMKAGKAPGPGGSLGKLHGSNIGWMAREFLADIVGPQVMAYESGDDSAEDWSKYPLRVFMGSIAGGTDEIQRNIIGDRVLGLPRDINVDKGVPFNELRVGTQTD
ncbi:MAG: acyl-CoA dehydrogenase family protein [Actinomycetota bacterium]